MGLLLPVILIVVAFTPEGERVLEWARRIVGDTRTMREEMRATRRGLAGHIRLSRSPAPTAANTAAPNTQPDSAPAMPPDSSVPMVQPSPVIAPQPSSTPPDRPRTASRQVGQRGTHWRLARAATNAPATSPAMPVTISEAWLALAAATPISRLAVETMPSLAPSTEARNQPMRSVRWRSVWLRRDLMLMSDRSPWGGL